MHLRLSDNSIKELNPSPAKLQYEIRDNRIGGFSIIIGQRTKGFAIQGDFRKDGKRVRIIRRTIGRFGNITTRRARIIAQQDLISISQGIIPPHRDRFGTPRSTPYQTPVNNNEAANKEITLKHAWEKYKVNHLERKNRSQKTIN